MEQVEKHFRRMNDPTSAAFIQGICGEEIEIYLVIIDKVIQEISFYTEGCGTIRKFGTAICEIVEGKHIDEVLNVSPKMILEKEFNLPKEDRHCAILAVMTFYKAVGKYLLEN